jgi:predicted nucleic acid-binding protein
MEALIDTCVWVDFFRPKTPAPVRAMAHAAINRPGAVVCEPVWLELLRGVSAKDHDRPARLLATLPLLATPRELWSDALQHAQACTKGGLAPSTIDLLIATVAMHHRACLVTFDEDFVRMAAHLPLQVEYLDRAALEAR